MLGVGPCVCLQWHSRRGHSEDEGVEVRGARCVLWEGDSGARYQVAFGSEVSSEGWAAQVGRLTGKIHLEPLQDGLKGQSWRQGGWGGGQEEAAVDRVFLPKQICPHLQPLFQSAESF